MRRSIQQTVVDAAIASGRAPRSRLREAAERRSPFSSTGWLAEPTRVSPLPSRKAITRTLGLDVTLVQGNGSGNTAQLVASGRSADCVRRCGRGEPADREGRSDEGAVRRVYQSNPNEVSAPEKDRNQVDQGPRRQEGGRSVRFLADDDASPAF